MNMADYIYGREIIRRLSPIVMPAIESNANVATE